MKGQQREKGDECGVKSKMAYETRKKSRPKANKEEKGNRRTGGDADRARKTVRDERKRSWEPENE